MEEKTFDHHTVLQEAKRVWSSALHSLQVPREEKRIDDIR